MEVPATALCDGADLYAARTIFCSVVTGLHFDFLNHVVVRSDDRSIVGADVHQARTVNTNIICFAAKSVDIVLIRGVCAATKCHELVGRRIRRSHNARKHPKELKTAAADNRKIVDLRGSNGVRTLACFSLYLSRLLRYVDRFSRHADFHRYIDCTRLTGGKLNAGLVCSFESRRLDLD